MPRDCALPARSWFALFRILPAPNEIVRGNKFSQTISAAALLLPQYLDRAVALLTTKTPPYLPLKNTQYPFLPRVFLCGTNYLHPTPDICIRNGEMTSPQENANANSVNGTAKLADPQKTVASPSTLAAVNGKPTIAARNPTAQINGHVVDPVASVENAGNGNRVIRPNSASSLPATPPTSGSQADTMMEQIPSIEAHNDQGSGGEQDDKTAQGEDGKRDLYVGNLYVTLYRL